MRLMKSEKCVQPLSIDEAVLTHDIPVKTAIRCNYVRLGRPRSSTYHHRVHDVVRIRPNLHMSCGYSDKVLTSLPVLLTTYDAK